MRTPILVWISSAARVGEMPTVYTKTFSLQLKTIKSSAEKLAFPIPNTYLGKTQKLKTDYHYRLCYRNMGYTWPTSSNLIYCNAHFLGTIKLNCLTLGFKIRPVPTQVCIPKFPHFLSLVIEKKSDGRVYSECSLFFFFKEKETSKQGHEDDQ